MKHLKTYLIILLSFILASCIDKVKKNKKNIYFDSISKESIVVKKNKLLKVLKKTSFDFGFLVLKQNNKNDIKIKIYNEDGTLWKQYLINDLLDNDSIFIQHYLKGEYKKLIPTALICQVNSSIARICNPCPKTKANKIYKIKHRKEFL